MASTIASPALVVPSCERAWFVRNRPSANGWFEAVTVKSRSMARGWFVGSSKAG